MATAIHPVDEMLPAPKLFTLGLQHVLVMYAGAIAVPLIVGRALQLAPEDVAFLISADLFVCGLVSILQSLGLTPWFGIRMPVMMGVTFASVGPMVSMAASNPGPEGARMIFGAIIGAGVIAILLAPLVSRMLRFFPPVVTGTIILIIGVTLMRVGINWIFGNPVGPTAPKIVDPAHLAWFEAASATAAPPAGAALAATMNNPLYAPVSNIVLSLIVLGVVIGIARFAKGFLSNIAVLCGIVVGAVIAAGLGHDALRQDRRGELVRADPALPLRHADLRAGADPDHDAGHDRGDDRIRPACSWRSSDMTGRKITQANLAAGLRMDGLGTILGGVFNTFPYTSFSQNVGLVGVTGIRSRFVCVAGGAIMIVLGLIPKMGALVEALPTVVLGGAGLVMFGMVAATGIRILSRVDFATDRNNLFIVAISIGFGMIPLVAPNFHIWLPHAIAPLIDSGILLGAIAAVVLNVVFNGAQGDAEGLREAAMADSGH